MAKFKPDGCRIWMKRLLECDGAVKPSKEVLCVLGIECRVLEFYKFAVAPLENHPFQTIRRDADEAFAFLALSIGEVVRHAPDDIFPFLIEVSLRFEYSAPDQSIKAAPDFGNTALEIERTEFYTELFDQELAKVGLHLIMTRTGGEVTQEFAGTRIVRQSCLNPAIEERSIPARLPNFVDNPDTGETHVKEATYVRYRSFAVEPPVARMARPTQQDLFKTETQPELFDPDAAPPAYRPDPDKVRARLQKILAEARAAKELPWEPDKVLLYRTIFPHMTGWLPDEEAAQLRFEFDTEMARLEAA